ncbi:type II secretion system protein GspG [Luteolibacter soli]|uniref:Type II secretion system protein GspG n=1 Tax=Luteolibacter soli TaxID=3135280 RepID=A0ABU9AW39_9BACT
MRIVGAFVLMGALALVWFMTLGRPEGAKLAYAPPDSAVISNTLKAYVINAGRLPSTEQGLMALVEEPKTGPKPRRWTQLMKRLPTDPWGNPYRYRLLSEERGKRSFELSSAGKDGILQTEDDWAKEIDW